MEPSPEHPAPPKPQGPAKPDAREGKVLLLRLWQWLRLWLHDHFSLQGGTDVEGTIATIEKGLYVRGEQAWVLLASTLICCIGLDLNSAAVVIGAMLISPLMNPILGVGLGVGINDRKLLNDALLNLATATGLTLLLAWLYFLITPLGEVNEQLEARTQPTLLDAGVAIFGGIAGIVANSRREKTNAIPGVAIATALMPPLCTAGYGLATGEGNGGFFGGAFYLFFLNAVFIALSTYLIVRYLKFPMRQFVNAAAGRRARRYIGVFLVLVLVPSAWIFVGVIRKQRQERSINQFLQTELHAKHYEIFRHEMVPVADTDSSVLKVYLTGDHRVSDDTLKYLQARLPVYNLNDCRLRIVQTNVEKSVKSLLTTVDNQQEALDARDRRILQLEQSLELLQSDTLPFVGIADELTVIEPDLRAFSYGRTVGTRFQGAPDTFHLFTVKWKPSLDEDEIPEREAKLKSFLVKRIDDTKVQVVTID